ncbi:MAG: AMP nucleosidase, partial [Rhizobacter sp.]|nr:AMP nucleosidase [Chlorobiales bacterium]
MATTKTEKDQVPSELAALKQEDIGRDMLERYTGVGATDLGDYVLLTNFSKYLAEFS